jgi:Fe-S-cluster-containing dehydrogenase component
MKTLLVDPKRCIQCCNCQNACKDEHCDNDWSPIAAKQGSSQFWIQVREQQAAAGSRMRLNRVPVICQQCADAPCIAAGGGAVYRRDDGIVIIEPEKARGNAAIAKACPYGAIYYNAELDLAQKCTLCAHLLDAGWERPRCVTACPVDAITFVDEKDLTVANLYAPLERLNPEFGTNPRVAYVNLPKPFVAGAVYGPEEDVCLEGATLALVGAANGAQYITTTDFLGEFRFVDVEPGFYALELKKCGYAAKTIERLDAREALNVDEIKLYKLAQY